MNGHAVQIVRPKDVGFELDVEALKGILLEENVRDKKVVILSVAGAYRKGKSFLLSFFLRYLKAKCSTEWLGDADVPLTGFSWKSGYEKHTSGIVMWSEVFFVTMPNNEEVAVILLDTEGTFDCKSSVQECALIFALSTMVSSVQVYNLSQVIHETDLQHLQLFTEYGRLSCENGSHNKSFQKLQILIRDWFSGKDFGIHAGEKYLQEILKISEQQKPELKRVRKHIKTCFKDLSCFLMPFPGENVAGASNYDGRLSGIKGEFIKQLKILVSLLLSPENLIIKEIGGKQINAQELVHYFQAYMTMFQSDKLPTPKSWYEATVQANNQIAADQAKNHYKSEMEKICSWDSPAMPHKQFYEEHKQLKKSAIDLFKNTRKMGEADFSTKYELQLNAEIDELYGDFQKSNEVKHQIEQVEMNQRREQDDLRQAINMAQTETEDVKKMMEENLMNEKTKQDELRRLLEKSDKETTAIKQMLEHNEVTANKKKEELKNEMKKMETNMEGMKKQMEQSALEKDEMIKNMMKRSAEEREEMMQQLKQSEAEKTALAMKQHEALIENMKKQMENNEAEFRREYEKLLAMAHDNTPPALNNVLSIGASLLGAVLPRIFRL